MDQNYSLWFLNLLLLNLVNKVMDILDEIMKQANDFSKYANNFDELRI